MDKSKTFVLVDIQRNHTISKVCGIADGNVIHEKNKAEDTKPGLAAHTCMPELGRLRQEEFETSLEIQETISKSKVTHWGTRLQLLMGFPWKAWLRKRYLG